MGTSEKDSKKCNRFRGVRPETEAKYRQAIELYRSTDLSCAEISRMCGLTKNELRGYIFRYHRDLMLARNNILCNKEIACTIKLNQLRGPLPASRIKYKEAIEACGSMVEGHPVDWSQVRKYNPATKAKYTEAIRRLKESGLPTAQVAAEFGLHPETFRSYSYR